LRKIKVSIGENIYKGVVKKYTDNAWICKVYKKGLLPIYKKLYARCSANTDMKDMVYNTALEYEFTMIK
jgi:hypothetical protein